MRFAEGVRSQLTRECDGARELCDAGEGGDPRRLPLRARTSVVLMLLILGSLLLPPLHRASDEPVEREWAARPMAAASEPTATPDPERETADAALPQRLRIPAVDVDAPIVPVGVTADGFMDAPAGPDDTGWYRYGPRPGEVGSAVIAGHSGFRSGPAVFDDLPKLEVGDTLIVTDAEGDLMTFRVRMMRTYRWDDSAPEVFNGTGGRYLNLVTCTGPWDAAAGSSSQRLVVFAEAVERREVP